MVNYKAKCCSNAGAIVAVVRETPKERIVDFKNASILDEKTLDLDSNQMMYIVQESLDKSENALVVDVDNAYDAQGRRIKNLADPQDDQDAVTKHFANQVLAQAQANADAARASAQAAQVAESNAKSHRDTALTAANTATSAANQAVTEVNNAINNIRDEGDTQVARTIHEGDTQVARVQAEGNIQTANAKQQADRAENEANRAKTIADSLDIADAFYAHINNPFAHLEHASGIEWNKKTDVVTRIGAANGKSRDWFDTIYPWAGMRRCVLADNGTVVAYYGEPGFREDGSNGQVMVEIPKFWYKSYVTSTGYKWLVADRELPTFKLHPAFIRSGRIIDHIYLSAYEGCIYDVSAGKYLLNDEQVADFENDKLSSIAGAKPASGLTQNLTIVNARKLAQNRGPGWELLDFLTSCAIQLLMYIEYATYDMQSAIGLGVVNKPSGTGNEAELTGQTSHLGNQSGMADCTNGLVSVSYRGIENFWGNIWIWVDGINIQADHKPWVADHGFESDLFTEPYKPLGVILSDTNGYVSDIAWTEEYDYGFLPSETTGSSSTGLTDYHYQDQGNRVALLGGPWFVGLDAGAACWLLADASSTQYRRFGARLLYIPG